MDFRFAFATAVTLIAIAPRTVEASSDAAWSAFRADVTQKCTVEGKKIFRDPIVVVDPHGTPSYGVALLYGRPQTPAGAPQRAGLASAVCVYDKKTKKAEVSGALETSFS